MWYFLCNFPFFVDWCSPVHALCVIKLVDSHHFERYQFTLQPISNSVICTSEHVDQFVYEKIEFERENGAKTCNQRPISTAQSDSAITPTHRNSLGSSCNVHNWHDCYICNLLWIFDPMRVATEFGIFSLFYQKNRTWMMIGILTEFQEKTRKTCHYSPIISRSPINSMSTQQCVNVSTHPILGFDHFLSSHSLSFLMNK